MMDRLSDETEYALIILHEMRRQATANPQLYDAQALAWIEETIALLQSGSQGIKVA